MKYSSLPTSMARALTLSAGLTAFIALVLVHETCSAATITKVNDHCAPSSCGNVHNISFPFRLKTDPKRCGDSRYELSCENNRAVLYLFEEKYYVQEINYIKYTIRIVDSGIYNDNYFPFSTSNFSLYGYNFTQSDSSYTSFLPKITEDGKLSRSVVLMSCEKPVNSPLYLGTSCIDNGKSSSNTSTSHLKRYRYFKVGRTNAADVVDLCKVEQMFLTSWPRNDDPNISCKDVHNELVYGFEISWLLRNCDSICKRKYSSCYLNDKNHVQCGRGFLELMLLGLREWPYTLRDLLPGYLFQPLPTTRNGILVINFYRILNIVLLLIAAKMVFGTPCVVALLIYKWCRRHLSMYDAIEEFLQSQINLMPIRYTYSKIKKMSKGFKDKLGEGGYGFVYKGKLESGSFVGIKMLGNSKANGQEFISEVATIGRIHHVNVVQLIGFCAEGPKIALI